jgi:hypothetical protein
MKQTEVNVFGNLFHHDGFNRKAQKNAKQPKIDETRESPGERVRVFRFISRVSRSLSLFLIFIVGTTTLKKVIL